MNNILRIGEYPSLGTMPYFYPLRHVFNEANWYFIPGSPADLDHALEQGEADVALASPLALVSSPRDYLIFPELGYSSRRHVRDILLFSDMLLDDMDEMTVSIQDGAATASTMIQIILSQYPQYQNQFIIGWGNADAYVLSGDSALRERFLARYSYVYDMGDLWRHYTGKAMIYYLWVVRKDALKKKKGQIMLFHRLLKQGLEISRADWDRLSALIEGYEWLKKSAITQLWSQVEYDLQPIHFEGLHRFYEDCVELEYFEEVPELEYFEHE